MPDGFGPDAEALMHTIMSESTTTIRKTSLSIKQRWTSQCALIILKAFGKHFP